MKAIRFNTPKGVFEMPLVKVATHRANYYAEKDGFAIDSNEFKEEVEFVLNDSFEGIDWLLNNSNPEDWQGEAVRVRNDVPVSEDDFWTSSDDFEIIDSELWDIPEL